MDRDDNLKIIASDIDWDLIVIGGGAMGLGCSMEAAQRGLKVLLLEANDFASGTSSRSSKMIHGGLRYLKQLDIAMVRQSLKERGHLLRQASNWVKEQRIIIPLYKRFDLATYSMGLFFYDLLAGSNNCQASKRLSAQQVKQDLPGLTPTGLIGGVEYSDGLFDDARLAIVLAQASSSLGATLVNHMPVSSLMKGNDGQLIGVRATDKETATDYEIRGKKIINAAGTFSDDIINMAHPQETPKQVISQGSHIVLPAELFPSAKGMLIPETDDGRLMFCLPWLGRVLVGTTDIQVDEASWQPKPQQDELDFIVDNSQSYFKHSIKKSDILSYFAGQRSLISANASSKELSRTHKIITSESGLISILGGKWTTYRCAAADAVDKISAKSKQNKHSHEAVLNDLVVDNLSSSDSKPIHPKLPYTLSQIERAVKDEMAVTLEDVLARRTRALFLDAKAAIACAEDVAKIMAAALGKDTNWINSRLSSFEDAAKQYLPQ